MSGGDRTVRDLRVLAVIPFALAIGTCVLLAMAIGKSGALSWLALLATATLSLLLLWFVARGGDAAARARMRCVWRWALSSGGGAFLVGGVAPFFFVADANMTPVFGLFFTAPPGFVIGAAIGWVRSRRNRVGTA